MTTGDFDFDSLFRLSPNGERDTDSDIPFPPISVMLWLIIILMPILLTNMLVRKTLNTSYILNTYLYDCMH